MNYSLPNPVLNVETKQQASEQFLITELVTVWTAWSYANSEGSNEQTIA
jgi:hypothetical protein